MEIIHSGSRHEIRRSVDVVDGPILPHPYSASGKRFRLAFITVAFQLVGTTWTPVQVLAEGPIVKSNGSDSKTRFSDPIISWKNSPDWEFVHPIIDGLRPAGAIDLPFGPFELETGR